MGIVFGIMWVILVSFTGKVRFEQRGEEGMALQVRQQPSPGGKLGWLDRVAGGLPKMSRGKTGQVSKAHEDFGTEVNGEPLEGTEWRHGVIRLTFSGIA